MVKQCTEMPKYYFVLFLCLQVRTPFVLSWHKSATIEFAKKPVNCKIAKWKWCKYFAILSIDIKFKTVLIHYNAMLISSYTKGVVLREDRKELLVIQERKSAVSMHLSIHRRQCRSTFTDTINIELCLLFDTFRFITG